MTLETRPRRSKETGPGIDLKHHDSPHSEVSLSRSAQRYQFRHAFGRDNEHIAVR